MPIPPDFFRFPHFFFFYGTVLYEYVVASYKMAAPLPSALLSNARASGQLNLSSRGLVTIPPEVWTMHDTAAGSKKKVDLSFGSEDRWWDATDLTKLLLASNQLTSIPDNIATFLALEVGKPGVSWCRVLGVN